MIDGVGDLAIDVNDTAESNGLVAELHALAIRFDCPIVCVLHENPGENPYGTLRRLAWLKRGDPMRMV